MKTKDKKGLTKVPKVIYLQVDGEFDESTWCDNRINDTDIKYVLADELEIQRNEVLPSGASEMFLHQRREFEKKIREQTKKEIIEIVEKHNGSCDNPCKECETAREIIETIKNDK